MLKTVRVSLIYNFFAMKNSKKEKLNLEDLQVQSFVTSLDSEVEKNVMGGLHIDPSHPTHTEPSDPLHPKQCGCATTIEF